MANEDFTTDPRMTSFSSAPGGEERRHITGWMVLGFMLAFFAIIIGVNVFSARDDLDLRRRGNRKLVSCRENVRARRRHG
jgi:hypothetical protein